jgi:hypothetical protein
MGQFLLVLADVLLLVASFIYRPNPTPLHPLFPHLGWFGLFLYVLVAALGAFGIGR